MWLGMAEHVLLGRVDASVCMLVIHFERKTEKLVILHSWMLLGLCWQVIENITDQINNLQLYSTKKKLSFKHFSTCRIY